MCPLDIGFVQFVEKFKEDEKFSGKIEVHKKEKTKRKKIAIAHSDCLIFRQHCYHNKQNGAWFEK